MNNCNLRLQVQESQNASNENWIRAAKFILKNPIHSEDMDNM